MLPKADDHLGLIELREGDVDQSQNLALESSLTDGKRRWCRPWSIQFSLSCGMTARAHSVQVREVAGTISRGRFRFTCNFRAPMARPGDGVLINSKAEGYQSPASSTWRPA